MRIEKLKKNLPKINFGFPPPPPPKTDWIIWVSHLQNWNRLKWGVKKLKNNLKSIKLTNFAIKKLTDKNLNSYFMIINNDNREEVYFCFQSRVKEGWDILSQSPAPLNLEIEYEESEQNGRIHKRTTALYTDDDIFV